MRNRVSLAREGAVLCHQPIIHLCFDGAMIGFAGIDQSGDIGMASTVQEKMAGKPGYVGEGGIFAIIGEEIGGIT